ncbi:hypothetical protein [Methylobacterium brachiatum]|uniref:hypothetical protein n=1 Tax=Methylobacterium brachiatum TaxID=269660 RepID=UPI001FE13009|nr:hypothetical protein [Methylobacterium brachiatum]
MGANWWWTVRWGLAVLIGSVWLAAAPARAEVRFGSGVRIGGHDFSGRRAGSVHIERVKRLRGPLGCRHVRHGFYRRGDGTVVRGPMEDCNLIAVPPGRR